MFYRARYRDPIVGWIGDDPSGFAGGLNARGIIEGDPINLMDPLGLWGIGDPLPQPLVDFSAGFGDVISLGATDWVRDQMGTNSAVDQCSSFYGAGEYIGYGWEIGLGGTGLARGFGWVISFDRYANAGGGGINVLKNGARQFGLDWHKFKLNGQMVNRPHYHRGPTKSQMKKHRPWQGGF